MYQTVSSTIIEPGIRQITLDRPDSLNAMNRQLIDETALAFRAANEDEQTRCIIFTGRGRAFCAGDDLVEHQHPENRQQAEDLVNAIQQVTQEIVHGDKLVVGAINGWAVGGGFEWAINCDFPIWAESARGFFPELSWGLFVTGGVTSLLPALVGLNKAREMLFLGKKYKADELLESGLAWRVCADNQLLTEAIAVARQLAELPQGAARDMKKTLNQTALTNLQNAMNLETAATVRGFLDPETTARIAGFKAGG
ncbi:MAG: enoyl-CoA hydratase/isomerase family protein [Gammaproteobacteria bacterium]|nr:enoyl-CoA hydratase/isomerase family protein [Gammaproteobacteria bacterium]